MKYIDIHCHLNFNDYDQDRHEVITRARNEGVGMIIVGTTLETSKKAVEIAEATDDIWAIVGLHPIYTPHEEFDEKAFAELAIHPRVVGIGECGFDYFRVSEKDSPRQKKAFLSQIDLANKVKKPLMLHIRNSANGKSAYTDALDILKTESKVKGDAHFFAGTVEEANRFYDLGFSTSFTGVVTFTRDYDDVVINAPKDMIMVETDAPYVSPEPYRGSRNEPSYVVKTLESIAKIRKEDPSILAKGMLNNARTLFNLSL
jgi:TatD DNase family protein